MTGILIRGKMIDENRHIGRTLVMIEAENGVIYLQAKNSKD